MRLAVFGGTGTVGTELLGQALGASHQVRLLARMPSKVTRHDPGLTVLQGDAKDPVAVAATLGGCDAVLSTLGGLADTDAIRLGTATILSTMPAAGRRRIVVMQGFHVDFPGDPHNVGRTLVLPLLWFGSRSLLPDSRAMAATIQASDLDWTVVRAPRVVRKPGTGATRTGLLELAPWHSVTAADVAAFMLRCVHDPASVRHAPMIAARRGPAPDHTADHNPDHDARRSDRRAS